MDVIESVVLAYNTSTNFEVLDIRRLGQPNQTLILIFTRSCRYDKIMNYFLSGGEGLGCRAIAPRSNNTDVVGQHQPDAAFNSL